MSLKQPSPLNSLLTHKQSSVQEKHAKLHTWNRKLRCLSFSLFSWMVRCCYPHFVFDRSRAAVISPAVNVSNQDCLLWEHRICNWLMIQAHESLIYRSSSVACLCLPSLKTGIYLKYLYLICCWGLELWGGAEHDNNKRGSLGVYVFLSVCVRVIIIQPEERSCCSLPAHAQNHYMEAAESRRLLSIHFSNDESVSFNALSSSIHFWWIWGNYREENVKSLRIINLINKGNAKQGGWQHHILFWS